jgi:hypothetical protein
MSSFINRLWAYVLGDFKAAAAVDAALLKSDSEVAWMQSHRNNDQIVEYALQAALRSAKYANESADGLTTKAATLITVIMGVLALALAGTGLAFRTSHDPAWVGAISIVAFVAVDFWLVLGALNAFLATAPAYAIGLNIKRLDVGQRITLRALKLEEAQAWHEGALQAMETSRRRGSDLFAARRCLLAAVVFSLPALVLSAGWIGSPGSPAPATPAPSHSASP